MWIVGFGLLELLIRMCRVGEGGFSSGSSKHVKTLGCCATLEVQRLFVEWFFPKDHCFSKGSRSTNWRECNFDGFWHVFYFHGFYTYIYILLIYLFFDKYIYIYSIYIGRYIRSVGWQSLKKKHKHCQPNHGKIGPSPINQKTADFQLPFPPTPLLVNRISAWALQLIMVQRSHTQHPADVWPHRWHGSCTLGISSGPPAPPWVAAGGMSSEGLFGVI